jgi:AcrR family transcriptional regulator
MERGKQTRAAILEAAVELLGREGPDGFSAAALAREAGVSKATLFHHFDALDAIPLAAFEQMLLETLTLEHRVDLPLRTYLETVGQDVISMAQERRDFLNAYFVFFTKALFDPRFRDRLAAGVRELHTVMKGVMAKQLERRTPRLDVEATTRLVGIALDGLGLHLLVIGDAAQLEAAWALLIDLLAAGEEQQ